MEDIDKNELDEKNSEDAKKMIAYLLRYIDNHMTLAMGEKNMFIAYCEDEERGSDIMFKIECSLPIVREKDTANNGKVTVNDEQ